MAADFDHTPWHADAEALHGVLRIPSTRRLSFAQLAVHHHRLLQHVLKLSRMKYFVESSKTDRKNALLLWMHQFGGDLEASTNRLLRVVELKIPYWENESVAAHGMPTEPFRHRRLADMLLCEMKGPPDVPRAQPELTRQLLRAYLTAGYIDVNDVGIFRNRYSKKMTPLERFLNDQVMHDAALLFLEFGADTSQIPMRDVRRGREAPIRAGDYESYLECVINDVTLTTEQARAAFMSGVIARAKSQRAPITGSARNPAAEQRPAIPVGAHQGGRRRGEI